MTRYASTTSVPVDRTRAEIERVLAKYGAAKFIYGWEVDRAIVGFLMAKRMIRFELPTPDRFDKRFTHDKGNWRRSETAAQKLFEQEIRSRWRALLLIIKAKLEAVESDIATFEEEFLAYIVLPNNQTVAQLLLPQIADAYEHKRMPRLLPSGDDE